MPNDPDIAERALAGTDDFRRIRAFLAGLHPVTPPGLLWDVRMWDGAWHAGARPEEDATRRARMRIFETRQGRMVGALLSEGDHEIHPQVHPDERHLEPWVIARGEALAAAHGDASVKILVWEHDDVRTRALEHRGYQRTERAANLYRRYLDARPRPPAHVPAGYVVRPTRADVAEHERLADLLNAAFERTRHHAAEVRAFQARALSFRRDLDLVAESDDGVLAAYAPVCWDDTNQRGLFEPVCTHPAHRRRGLARALLLEGIRRSTARGARSVDVGTGDAAPANALYRSVGFEERWRGWFWTRSLDRG